jgi:hypothetical protein
MKLKDFTDIKQYLSYDPETGLMMWIKKSNRACKINTPFTKKDDKGYIRIKFKYKNYRVHQLGWFFVYGYWPEKELDHINGIRDDNRISNLREVTHRQNSRNRPEHRRGHDVGIKFIKESKKNPWMAYSRVNKKQIYLGVYPTKQKAIEIVKNYEAIHLGNE